MIDDFSDAGKIDYIKRNLDTRKLWNKEDYVDFYERDVVQTLLPLLAALQAKYDRLVEKCLNKDFRTASCGCRWDAENHGDICPEHGTIADRESALKALEEE